MRRRERRSETLEPRTLLSGDYLQLSLASDLAGSALLQDPNLVGPWGMAVDTAGSGDLWVVNRGSGVSTHYSGASGTPASPFATDFSTVDQIGSQPTDVVVNGSDQFVIHAQNTSGPASLLFSSEDGKISGWNANVPPPAPAPSAEPGAAVAGAAYTGVALEQDNSRNLLYAADFRDNRIDVFNSAFSRVTLNGNFTDPNLPSGYAAFNIANLGGRLLVAYAVQDANGQDAMPGVARGFVDAFDYDGNFLSRFIAGGPASPDSALNAPWGMALAPAGFGDFSGELLVANQGDGKINAYDPTTGAYQGTLGSPSGSPLVVHGLHGLAFGNGLTAGDANTLFYTGDGSGGQQGVLGEIVSVQNETFPHLGQSFTATGDVAVNGVMAVFNDLHSAQAGDFLATINWGDGTPVSAGTVALLPSGGFGVLGNHTYFQPGQYNMSVAIQDTQATVVTATGSVNVVPAGLVFSPQRVQATEGLQFSGGVATFFDQDGNIYPVFYQATIDWGDGTVTPATLTGSGTFTISGMHTYASQGTEPITVSVMDTYDGATGTAHATATIASSLLGKPLTFTPTETISFTGKVASFSDANPSRPMSDYSALIDWGDDSTTGGTVTSDTNGGFDVIGTHTYADETPRTVAVAISDPGSTITTLSAARIADIDTLTGTASAVSGSEGTIFRGTVATFTDTLASASPDDFAAVIDWGDGMTTGGTVTVNAGVFAISGMHVYLDEGSFTIKAVVNDTDGTASATATSTANIADADVFTISPVTVTATAGGTFTGTVATAGDTNMSAVAGDFIATIDWGDGSTTSGMVSIGSVSGGSAHLTITGSHAYANEGTQLATVKLADDAPGAASATTTFTVLVTGGPPTVTATAVSGPERTSMTWNVATFSEPGSSVGADHFAATIGWGDGSTTPGTIATNGNTFSVTGAHTYADEGKYTFTVVVSRDGGMSTPASATATIVEPPLPPGVPDTPNTRWVNEIFGDLLHRAADPGALTYWSGQLAAGMSRGDVVLAIEASAEFRGDEVKILFETYLHREPDPSANTFGIDYLANHSVEQLATIVVGSPEYYQNRGGGTNDGFLDALFNDILHRPVDRGAKTYFDDQLQAGVSRGAIVATILNSDEFLRDLVQSFYVELLDRPGDDGGLTYFADQLKQGASDLQVMAVLAASDEYFAKTSQ